MRRVYESLEREIASVFRKVARKLVKEGGDAEVVIDAERIPGYLGVPKFRPRSKEGEAEVGTATGLAWTEVGGELLSTEVDAHAGKG